MSSTLARSGSILFALCISAGFGCGGGSAGSRSSTNASAGANSGGSAGFVPAGPGGSAGHPTSGGGASPGNAGSTSSPGGGMSNGASGSAQAGAASGGGGAAGRGGGASTGGTSSAGAGGPGAVNCPASDPLKIGNAKADAYDCVVLQLSAKWDMPDPMIVKCQIQQESSFNVFAISGDSPCGIRQGWSDAESKSFGLIQTTPACGEASPALLPSGHPNLDQDMTQSLWTTSVFNPSINLDAGLETDTASLKALKNKYPGCADAQYNMMAAGAFNSGDNAVLGCGMYNARAQMYVDAITSHYHQFALAADWPDPY